MKPNKNTSEKIGISDNSKVLIINAPSETIKELNLPVKPAFNKSEDKEFDHIILFTKKQSQLDNEFPKYKKLITETGKLWVAWPKGGQFGTDLNRNEVIKIGYNHGLVESMNLSINDTWTALKFTHPKPDKVYNNSYGKLP